MVSASEKQFPSPCAIGIFNDLFYGIFEFKSSMK